MELDHKKTLLETVPFNVEELHLRRNEKPMSHPYYRIHCPDWVNVLPVTRDGQAVLIRQPRAGTLSQVLEIPGGVIDMGENDPTMAAARELEEETGYTSQRMIPLSSINPNPAIQTNKCHLFLAMGCMLNPERQHFPDAEESIEVVLRPVADLETMIRTGEINHALCGLTIMLSQKYLQ